MPRDTDQQYWQALARQVGGACDFYSAEDLGAFVEGRVRGRNARALEAHLRDCSDCRQVVAELRRELAPEPLSVRVRFGRAPGWAWAATVAVTAAAVFAVLLLRPGEPGIPVPPGPAARPPVSVAEVPRPQAPALMAPHAPTHTVAAGPTAARTPWTRAPRPGRATRPAGSRTPQPQRPPPGDIPVNVLPETAALAFGEALVAPLPSTATLVEELLRQGAVNDLPPGETGELTEASLAEFYQGFQQLEQDLLDEVGRRAQ